MTDRLRKLFPGTVDLLILKTLSNGSMHGFQVSRDLRARSEDVIILKDAALYQALHRLERQGWVESEWGLSENNRRAKYYRLSGKGRQELVAKTRGWTRLVETVGKALAAPRQPTRSEA